MVGRLVRNPPPRMVVGTYTPTQTGVSNVAANTAYLCRYVRIGDQVTVTGQVAIDPTAAAPTSTELGVSLPIASDFASLQEDCSGVFASNSINQSGLIAADTGNNRAQFLFSATSTANAAYKFTFTYVVI